MNVTLRIVVVTRAAAAMAFAAIPVVVQSQAAATPVARLVAEPAQVSVRVGDSVMIRITAYDASGRVIEEPAMRVTGARGAVAFNGGVVRAFRAGQFTLTASAAGSSGQVEIAIPVAARWPALTRIEIAAEPGRLYTGATLQHTVRGFHDNGSERRGVEATWRSSDASVASVDRFGAVTAHRAGAVSITAEADGARSERQYTVAANPVARVDIEIPETEIRTGDVVKLRATARRADGTAVADAALTWSYTYTPDDTIQAPGGPGIIDNGLFAANYGGRYTLLAHSGNVTARTTLQVRPRDVRQRITVQGRGTVSNVHTSDLWPWTGKDGRDYCIVGTWGGDGYAYIFDITDINNIVKTDSVKVDARTINDVTISPDGRYGVIAREGASNRVNGVVLIDLANPAHPKIASTFTQELTGGVHNMFATNDHVFAISGGQKYVIIDAKDIYNPKYVSEYRHPSARIHDLWVHDGIAYSAQGGVGTVVVDVGNGKYGGTIQNPRLINVVPVNSGHEIYPYFQKATGKVYLFIGDEEMSRAGRVWEGTNYRNAMTTPGGVAQTSGGYTHIFDFTDPMNPRKVGRYHLEDYGSHDIIVQDDVLYQAYYDGGVRVVDVSGELLGNLYDQGREIAVFKPYDPQGFTANAPFVMNAMPWKGHVLFTDFNSGLWAVKVEPRPRAVVQ